MLLPTILMRRFGDVKWNWKTLLCVSSLATGNLHNRSRGSLHTLAPSSTAFLVSTMDQFIDAYNASERVVHSGSQLLPCVPLIYTVTIKILVTLEIWA